MLGCRAHILVGQISNHWFLCECFEKGNLLLMNNENYIVCKMTILSGETHSKSLCIAVVQAMDSHQGMSST